MAISSSANAKYVQAIGPSTPAGTIAGINSEPAGHSAGSYAPGQELHKTRDRIVIFMMFLVAAAAGFIFYIHLGYSIAGAAAVGAAIWAGFLALHTLRKRSAQVSRLRQDLSRLEQEIGRLRPQSPAVAAVKLAGTEGSGSPAFEPSTAKAKSSASAASAPADALRAKAPASSTTPSQWPASVKFGPESADGTPERISPVARWETPEIGRTGKFVIPPQSPITTVGPEAQPQNAVPPPRTSVADRFTNTAVSAAQSTQAGARTAETDLFEAPSWSGTSITSSDPLRDAWSFRPKEAAEPRPFAADAGGIEEHTLQSSSHFSGMRPQGIEPRGLDSDLEMVQRKIKAMAEEVNAAEATRQRSSAGPARATPPTAIAAMSGGNASAPVDFGTAAMAIEDGISALKNAVGAMRSPTVPKSIRADNTPEIPSPAMLPPAELVIPSTAQTIAVSAAPVPADASVLQRQIGTAPAVEARGEPERPRAAAPPVTDIRMAEFRIPELRDPRVAEIAKAIEEKTMDVLLSPIVGLGDYAVTHFEVSVRLLGGDGAIIDRSEEALTLAGNQLLALFDAERLSRTAAVAELLQSRGKLGAIMTAAMGASMSDTNFLETFARVYETRNAISGQLVLTFSQSDVEAFGSGTWQALSDMHSFGFRFALDHVTHLGMDFEYLAQCGFTFVKLPAQVFLKGLPSDSGFITVNDICRHLARCGLTLVVESVDDEALLAKVFGFGALFGQGQLFGAPRQISLDTLAPARSAAA